MTAPPADPTPSSAPVLPAALAVDLPVAGRAVLVVGHGPAAWRCARRQVAAGADVTVVSPTGAWRADADWVSLLPSAAVRLVEQAPATARLRVVDAPGGPGAALRWAELLAHAWLVHLATADAALSHEVALSCAARRLWCLAVEGAADEGVEADPSQDAAGGAGGAVPGSITLVGGGPGDPGLITVAGVAALARADVVLVDRLAPRTGLAAMAPGAAVLDVGKSPGRHAVPQAGIEDEMVACARAGARVVRLKGGDPYVFGRGFEEVAAARAAGIEVAVVPGVSSAVAAPAAAGIPLTHRGTSHCVSVVSAHDPLDEAHLAHLAGLLGAGATVVVLMGVATLPHTAAGLLRHGGDAALACALVESATTADQRTTTSVLGSVVVDAARAGVRPPAVVVLGRVAALAGTGAGAARAGAARAASAPAGGPGTPSSAPRARRGALVASG